MASDRQRDGGGCAGGADGDLLGAVLYGPLGLESADMTIEHAAGSQAFYGFPHGPVSTPNAGGKCVTAGETAPNLKESNRP